MKALISKPLWYRVFNCTKERLVYCTLFGCYCVYKSCNIQPILVSLLSMVHIVPPTYAIKTILSLPRWWWIILRSSYRYIYFHKDTTVSRPSYLDNSNTHTWNGGFLLKQSREIRAKLWNTKPLQNKSRILYISWELLHILMSFGRSNSAVTHNKLMPWRPGKNIDMKNCKIPILLIK